MYSPMPRTRVNYRIDDRVLKALKEIAGEGRTNQFVEGILITFLQNTRKLPSDFEPLTETRGGRKKNSIVITEDPVADLENN